MKFTGVLKVVELLVSVGFAVSATNLPRSCFILTRNTACIRGYAYLCDRWGLYILDVRNLQSPHRVGSWGTDIEAVKVKGSLSYVTQGSMGTNSLDILNVSNPAPPWQEGILSGLTGADIYLVDTFLFLPGFDVVDIADSSRPRLVASEPPVLPRTRTIWSYLISATRDAQARLGATLRLAEW